jgi:integrase
MSQHRPMRIPRTVPGVENRLRHNRDGTTYWQFRVRWTDPVSGKRLVEIFAEQRDAIDFRAHLRLARRGGVLHDLSAGRETMADYAEEWWRNYAAHNLTRPTLATYSSLWNRHALPRLGHLELRTVTPGVIARFRADLEAAGTGAPTVRKTMSMLQAMLRRAVEEDRLKTNPVAQVRKPAAPRTRAVQPLAPTVIEAMRRAVAPAEPAIAATDAALLSLLAYAGLRPEEALALEWRHVRRDTLLVEQKNVDGRIIVGQKVIGRAARTVDLLAALRGDLREYRLAAGRPVDSELIFPRADGDAWRDYDYRNWRRRVYQPATVAAGVATLEQQRETVLVDGQRRRRLRTKYAGPRPYDLRHSFASLLIHEGRLSVVELAHQLGNSPETLLRTYAHVFAELRGQPKVPADVQIAKARSAGARRIGS